MLNENDKENILWYIFGSDRFFLSGYAKYNDKNEFMKYKNLKINYEH